MEKPTVDTKAAGSVFLAEKRRKAWKRQMKKAIDISSKDKKRVSEILHKWRKKQRKLLGVKCVEDPHPFQNTYVFYCLDGRCSVDM